METTQGSMAVSQLPDMGHPAGVEEQGMLTWGFPRNLGGPVFSTANESASGEAEPEFSWPTGVVFGA